MRISRQVPLRPPPGERALSESSAGGGVGRCGRASCRELAVGVGTVGTREGQNSQLPRSPTCPGKETQPSMSACSMQIHAASSMQHVTASSSMPSDAAAARYAEHNLMILGQLRPGFGDGRLRNHVVWLFGGPNRRVTPCRAHARAQGGSPTKIYVVSYPVV